MQHGDELHQAARTLKINSPDFWAEAERIVRATPGFALIFDDRDEADAAYRILRGLTEGHGWQPGDPAILKRALETARIGGLT